MRNTLEEAKYIRKWIIFLEIVLVAWIFTHLTVTALIYANLPSEGFIDFAEQAKKQQTRINLYQISEKITSVASILFYAGAIMTTYKYMIADWTAEICKIIFLFAGTVAAIGILTGIFSIIFPEAAGDFFYPLWTLFLFLGIDFVVAALKKGKLKRNE